MTTLTKPSILSVSTLAGYRVRSHRNEDLGTVEEIIIRPSSGRIAYAVLCFGGTYGFGDRLFAVPWALLHLDVDDRVLILNCDYDRLHGAPTFDPDDWPDFADEGWERAVLDFYGLRKVKPAGN